MAARPRRRQLRGHRVTDSPVLRAVLCRRRRRAVASSLVVTSSAPLCRGRRPVTCCCCADVVPRCDVPSCRRSWRRCALPPFCAIVPSMCSRRAVEVPAGRRVALQCDRAVVLVSFTRSEKTGSPSRRARCRSSCPAATFRLAPPSGAACPARRSGRHRGCSSTRATRTVCN